MGLVHGGSTDFPGGHVDDAPQPQVVGGVIDDTQVGQHVLHLGPVEELGAADDFIGHAVALAGIFQRVGLGVHPVEDGVVLPVGATAIGHHDLAQHVVGLVALVEGGFHRHRVAGAVVGPQRLALAPQIVADHAVGRVQNVLGGAVILLQADGTGPLILALKVEDILNIGATEAVNALVVIAHHADVPVSACQEACQLVLQIVGVLILVNQHVAELPLVVFPHLPVVPQQPHRVQNDVVEVQSVGLKQLLRVKAIHFTYSDFTPFSGTFPLLAELLRRLHTVLGVGHHRQHLPHGKSLLVQVKRFQTVLYHPLAVIGVIDSEVTGKAHVLNVPPQNADAGAVERGGPHVPGLLPQHPLQALFQLCGGLVGKRDGQHLPGPGRLHGAEILHQRLLGRVGVLDIPLQKLHLIPGNGHGDFLRVAAPSVF